MDSLRLPPLNFESTKHAMALARLQCVLPPISPQVHLPHLPHYSHRHHHPHHPHHPSPPSVHLQIPAPTTPLLPSLSPLLTATSPHAPTHLVPQCALHRPITQHFSPPMSSISSPASSTSSLTLLPKTPPQAAAPSNLAAPAPVPPVLVAPAVVAPMADAPTKTITAMPVKRAIHTPRGVREVYTCPFPSCNRISSEHSNMKAHMRLHTGERPYVCRVSTCRKSFRWKSSLTYHERALHSNARPYRCGPCRRSFVEKRKLRLHHQLCPAVRAARSDFLANHNQHVNS